MNWRRLLFNSNLTGDAGIVPTIVRVLAGLTLIGVSLSKFTRYEDLVDSFIRYGIPLPEQSVYLAGTVELVGGFLLLIGLITRLAAIAVAGNMLVAVLTGGRIDVDFFHTGLGLILLFCALFLIWSGPGKAAVDNRWADHDSLEPPEPRPM